MMSFALTQVEVNAMARNVGQHCICGSVSDLSVDCLSYFDRLTHAYM